MRVAMCWHRWMRRVMDGLDWPVAVCKGGADSQNTLSIVGDTASMPNRSCAPCHQGTNRHARYVWGGPALGELYLGRQNFARSRPHKCPHSSSSILLQ